MIKLFNRLNDLISKNNYIFIISIFTSKICSCWQHHTPFRLVWSRFRRCYKISAQCHGTPRFKCCCWQRSVNRNRVSSIELKSTTGRPLDATIVLDFPGFCKPIVNTTVKIRTQVMTYEYNIYGDNCFVYKLLVSTHYRRFGGNCRTFSLFSSLTKDMDGIAPSLLTSKYVPTALCMFLTHKHTF